MTSNAANNDIHAIRGKLIHQVASDQVPVALPHVTGPETLFSFYAGANDVLRPNYKAEIALPLYAQTVRTIAASSATLLLLTVLERTDRQGKTADLWARRFSEFNKNFGEVGSSLCGELARAIAGGCADDHPGTVDPGSINFELHGANWTIQEEDRAD